LSAASGVVVGGDADGYVRFLFRRHIEIIVGRRDFSVSSGIKGESVVKVIVFGATGRTGSCIVEQAAEA
jgi:hypothetical protein